MWKLMKLIKQFQCQACGKSMSAKNFKYSHAAYCAKRVKELDKPKAIPVPKKIIPKSYYLSKELKQDVESDDDEADFVKGSIMASGDTEINAMTNLKIKLQRHKKSISQTIHSQIYQCIKLRLYKDLKTYYSQHRK